MMNGCCFPGHNHHTVNIERKETPYFKDKNEWVVFLWTMIPRKTFTLDSRVINYPHVNQFTLEDWNPFFIVVFKKLNWLDHISMRRIKLLVPSKSGTYSLTLEGWKAEVAYHHEDSLEKYLVDLRVARMAVRDLHMHCATNKASKQSMN